MAQGRRTNSEILAMRELIKKIMAEKQITSPAQIDRILKEEYHKEISKPTLLNICRDLTPVTKKTEESLELEYENHPEIRKINQRIRVLEIRFRVAEKNKDDILLCKISDQITAEQKGKLILKKTLKETDILTANTDRQSIIVKFGDPSEIKIDKPFFKTDDKQKPLPIKEGEKSE